MSSPDLIEQLRVQNRVIRKVLDITVCQRDALKKNDISVLNDLVKELSTAQNEAIAAEVKRDNLTRDLAAELTCEPQVSSLITSLPETEAEELKLVALELEKTVKLAKAEMQILDTLVEESKSLNEMLVNEWRRLGGSTPRSGLDLKG